MCFMCHLVPVRREIVGKRQKLKPSKVRRIERLRLEYRELGGRSLGDVVSRDTWSLYTYGYSLYTAPSLSLSLSLSLI